jgi:hypothetical protein
MCELDHSPSSQAYANDNDDDDDDNNNNNNNNFYSILLCLAVCTNQLTPGCDGYPSQNEWLYFSTPRHMPSWCVL